MNKKYTRDKEHAFTGTDDTSIPVITEEDLRMAMDAAKKEWDTVDAMMHGNFTPDSEQEYVKKRYQAELEKLQNEWHQHLPGDRWYHYYKERIKEITEKLKALDAAPGGIQTYIDRIKRAGSLSAINSIVEQAAQNSSISHEEYSKIYAEALKYIQSGSYNKDAQPSARYQELLKKRDEAEKKAHSAKTKEEQDKWIKLMWKYNDELKWLGPEVANPTKGPAPDGSGESWLPRRR